MSRVSYRVGYDVFGIHFMKFTLTYEGRLPSSNRPKIEDVWKIRKEIEPQIKDLWASHPALKFVEDNRHFPKHGGAPLVQAHHLHPGPVLSVRMADLQGIGSGEILDLCEPIKKQSRIGGTAWFRPLVRHSYALHCGLKIVFLRHEPPGKVYQGGDIDNRVATLLDALAMPKNIEQVLENNDERNAIYCLMEGDAMLSGYGVESERLLACKDQPTDYVKLLIEVDVRVHQATVYNQSFL